MKVMVNGESREFPQVKTVGDLLRTLNADARRVAVVVNDEIVPSEKWDLFAIRDGDRIEVLIFVGGG
jgi:sulfur carrier protein